MIKAIYETETGNIKTWIPEWFSTGVAAGLAISPLLDIEYTKDEKGYPVQDGLPTNVSEVAGFEIGKALLDLTDTDSKMSRPEEDSIIAQAWAGNPVAGYSYNLAVQRRQLRETAVEGYVIYWWNRDSNLVHRTTCQHCDTETMLPLEASEARQLSGLTACADCNPEWSEIKYDLNSTGTYHRLDCKFVGDALDLHTLEELAILEATPCAVCNPPACDSEE